MALAQRQIGPYYYTGLLTITVKWSHFCRDVIISCETGSLEWVHSSIRVSVQIILCVCSLVSRHPVTSPRDKRPSKVPRRASSSLNNFVGVCEPTELSIHLNCNWRHGGIYQLTAQKSSRGEPDLSPLLEILPIWTKGANNPQDIHQSNSTVPIPCSLTTR